MPLANLLDIDAAGLDRYVESLGERPFRARQLLRWIHQRGAGQFAQMTDLAKSLRAQLEGAAVIAPPPVLGDETAADGTRKWLLDVGQGNAIETVFIPEDDRGTLCISTQAGCAVNCRFCSTGKQGFSRNLTTSEIIGQLWLAEHTLRAASGMPGERVISNVVLMGMGEPLHNYGNVARALRLLVHKDGIALSTRRVTVSTSGLVPEIDRLGSDFAGQIALAVSLHAPEDSLRSSLMPINKRYPLRELMAALERYPLSPRRRITIEYTLIKGVNDSDAEAKALVRLLRKIRCKVNLIPMNPVAGTPFEMPSAARVDAFQSILWNDGIGVFVRKQRGDDIAAACGQLALQGELARKRRLPMMMADDASASSTKVESSRSDG